MGSNMRDGVRLAGVWTALWIAAAAGAAVTDAFVATPVALSAGAVVLTTGGVVSGPVSAVKTTSTQ